MVASNPIPPASPPDPAGAAPSLPELPTDKQTLLDAFEAADFDFFTFARSARQRGLSSRELARFGADPDIQAHIEELMLLARKSLYLHAVKCRHAAMRHLNQIADTTEDLVEKRRASTQLLRATSSPITVSFAPSRGDEPPEPAPTEAPVGPPRVRYRPQPDYSQKYVLHLLDTSLVRNQNDLPDADSGLATVAEFCAQGATINGEPIPHADTAEAVEVLEDSTFSNFVGWVTSKVVEYTEQDGCITQTVRFGTDPDGITFPWLRTYVLKKSTDSRYPGCWLIASIDVRPNPAAINTS